jgi:hypothetical protein
MRRRLREAENGVGFHGSGPRTTDAGKVTGDQLKLTVNWRGFTGVAGTLVDKDWQDLQPGRLWIADEDSSSPAKTLKAASRQ